MSIQTVQHNNFFHIKSEGMVVKFARREHLAEARAEVVLQECCVRDEVRRQYREEGTLDCPDKYTFGTWAAIVWTSEAQQIAFETELS